MFPGVNPLQYNRINGKAIKVSDLVAKVTEILG
jgi:2-oxoglutarate ferredoxin oxidoreductase subunit alpha